MRFPLFREKCASLPLYRGDEILEEEIEEQLARVDCAGQKYKAIRMQPYAIGRRSCKYNRTRQEVNESPV